MGLLKRRKKVVKPTPEEYRKVTARLLRNYPQMFEVVGSSQQMKAYLAATPTERKTLKRTMPLRMKKKYGKR